MFQITKEAVFYEYFLLEAIYGKYFDKSKVFAIVAENYVLNEEETRSLFAVTQRPEVAEIDSRSNFCRYKRIVEYKRMVGQEDVYDKELHSVILIKGNAYNDIHASEWTNVSADMGSFALSALLSEAQRGNVIALKVLGLLQCAGIVAESEKGRGLSNLRKAAHWGDIAATLALLRYEQDDRRQALAMLTAAVSGTPYEYLPYVVRVAYGLEEVEANAEILLLKKAFVAKRFNPLIFDALCARFLFADSIELSDKEKIIFSPSKELIPDVCNLPLRLTYGDLECDQSAMMGLFAARDAEDAELKHRLDKIDMRATSGYKPLCICSDSQYVTDWYISAIEKAFAKDNVERIDVAELRQYDFEPNRNNVFLRFLDEKKNNVLVLVFRGKLPGGAIDMVGGFLDANIRRRFRLNYPAFALDLSSVLVICVCDKENAAKLDDLVDVVSIAPATEQDKRDVINACIKEKSEVYHIARISVASEAMDRLLSVGLDTVVRLIDEVALDHRGESDLTVTEEMIEPYMRRKHGGKSIGFGGV